jgi:hypothetical protein
MGMLGSELVVAPNDITNPWWTLAKLDNSTANTMVANAQNASHDCRRQDLIVANKTFFMSAKVKKGDVNLVFFSFTEGVNRTDTWFNLSTGTIATNTNDFAVIEGPDTDGFYTVSIRRTFTIVGVPNIILFGPTKFDNDFTYVGDNVTVSTHIKNISFRELLTQTGIMSMCMGLTTH